MCLLYKYSLALIGFFFFLHHSKPFLAFYTSENSKKQLDIEKYNQLN